MIETEQPISADSVAELARQMEAAHDLYSARFHAREQLEQQLHEAGARRAKLIERRDLLLARLRDAVQTAISAAGDGAVFAHEATHVSGLRAQLELMQQSILHWDSYPMADAQRS